MRVPLPVLVLLGALVGCTSSSKIPQTPLLNVEVGDYLREDYIEALRATKSPRIADRAGGQMQARVRSSSGELRLTIIYNFHEGSDDLAPNADGYLGPKGGPALPVRFKVTDRTHFTLNDPKEPESKFAFVGDLENYMRRAVIAGEYSDKAGKTYRFLENGTAEFPSGTFSYAIGTDHVFDDFDYYIKKTNSKTESTFFGFKRDRDGLMVYEVTGEFPTERLADKPMLLLNRIR